MRGMDSEGWAALVKQHSKGLYSIARQMLGDRAEAEDVVQETFLRAYVATERRGIEVHTSTRAFLARIAVNLCYDRLRRKGWHETPTEADDLAVIHEIARPAGEPPQAGPEDSAIQSDTSRELREAVLRLQPNYRAAVVLRYSHDLSYREIADSLGVPENTVATWLRRAHMSLRRMLEPSPKEEPALCRATAHA